MKVSVPFHSATVDTCVELVTPCPVVLSVCPMCYVPFVLLLEETQAFQPHSRQGGAKVRCQFRQGGRGSISLVFITSSVIISTIYKRKTLSGLETSFYMTCCITFMPLGPLSKGMYYTSLRAREPCPLQSGWCLDLLTWLTLKYFPFIRGI